MCDVGMTFATSTGTAAGIHGGGDYVVFIFRSWLDANGIHLPTS